MEDSIPYDAKNPDMRVAIADAFKSLPAWKRKQIVDGWLNELTSLGTALDKRTATSFSPNRQLSRQEIDTLYSQNGLFKKIIDLPAKEMMRRGYIIEGDEDGTVKKLMKRRGINVNITELVRTARLFGGAIGVIGVSDGRSLEQPINMGSIKSVDSLRVYDRWVVSYTTTDLYKGGIKAGQPEWYTVSAPWANFRVHESRVVVMDGADVSDYKRQMNNGWGDPIAEQCYEQIRGYGAIMAATEAIMEDFVQAVLEFSGLNDTLMQPDGVKLLRDRLNVMDLSRHILNLLVIEGDGKEKFTKHASSIAGIPDLIDRHMQNVSTVADGIPVSILFGRSAAGLNSTGDLDLQGWYNTVAGDREVSVDPVLYRILELVFASNEVADGIAWDFSWPPMWEPSAKESAEIEKYNAERDAIYFDMAVVDSKEIRSRPEVQKIYNLSPTATPPASQDSKAKGSQRR